MARRKKTTQSRVARRVVNTTKIRERQRAARVKRLLAELKRKRILREKNRKLEALIATPQAVARNPSKKKQVLKTELATQSSTKRAREEQRKTCKQRPDSKKAARVKAGQGAKVREFKPWCNRT